MDIVYPYHAPGSGWAGNELRFSLRSLEKHFTTDFRVWTIGDRPAWATEEINHIPAERAPVPTGGAFSNNADIVKKITLACHTLDRFLLIADDQYLLQDMGADMFARPFYFQTLETRPPILNQWGKRLWATVDRLKDMGLTTYNAECHTPFLVKSDWFLQLHDMFFLADGTHLWKTAYLNYHYQSTGACLVPKRATAFSKKATDADFAKTCRDAWFLCQNDAGLTDALKSFLMTRFNRPSRFEKYPPVESKIFGIGMPKTGTNSLTHALQEFGYRSKHYPKNPMEMGATIAATDLPVANNFVDLDKKYENAKFILTVRDDDSWRESAVHHFRSSNKNNRAFAHRKKMFNARMPNEEQLMAGKSAHENKVLTYFKDRPADLLVLDIFNGDGYQEMARFLNRADVPEGRFPHLNKRQEQN